jgi:protease-4
MSSRSPSGRLLGARRALRALPVALLLLMTGCISVDVFGGGPAAELVETVVRGDEGPKILIIDIDGLISGADVADSLLGRGEYSMVARVRETLDRARKDEDIKAILLRIDSPGGTATASEQVYTEIVRFRDERKVPVVAQMQTTAASGGYYVAMAADTVQAHPTSVTGSIGVIYTSVNFSGLMEKLGIEDQTITGGIHKDAGSAFRPLTEIERAQLQSVVDDLHARFRVIVGRGRPELSAEQIEILADGRIFSAPQALENGLVDRIGTIEDAVILLEGRLGVQKSQVVSYHRPREIRRNLYTGSTFAPTTSAGGLDLPLEVWALQRFEQLLGRPGFHYLWSPGFSP